MKELLTKLEVEYADELESQIPLLEQRIDALRTQAKETLPGIRLAKDGLAAGTISYADMKMLYLLVRHFKPKAIFEIGTWIGTSAMVMAEAMEKNGSEGIIYTCDTADCYVPQDQYQHRIKKITAFSDVAIDQIPLETKIDFIFADGEFTFSTIRRLQGRLDPHSIVATHDYVLPAEKGVLNYLRLQLTTIGGYQMCSAKEASKAIHADTIIAVIFRDPNQNIFQRIIKILDAFMIGVIAAFVRIYRKFSGYYNKQ